MLQLRQNLHWCDCGGRAIFLDLRADRYFCLPRRTNAAFLRLVANEAQPRDFERLEPLLRRGLLVESDASQPIQPAILVEPPQNDLSSDSPARVSLFEIMQAISSELRIAWLLRRRPLHEVIEKVRLDKPATRFIPRDGHQSIEAVSSAAAATALLLRSHDRCLVRGLALHSSCRKRGIRTTLVLGVVAHPFTAHCWVQFGSAVLTGGYEQARLHTPIFVLE